tara:strand:+ start:979 stop:2436 length:1458 start_codon:yes stop_codon:yes gene_type:complete
MSTPSSGFLPGNNAVGKFSINPMPNQSKYVTQENYLNFHDGSADWTQQFLPELYEAEVERYGNRTLGGFLRMVGAEMPMTSDQVIWSEQNRLHIGYDSVKQTSNTNKIDIILPGDDTTCAIRKGATINVSGTSSSVFKVVKARVIGVVLATSTAGVVTATVEALAYNAASLGAEFATNAELKVFVYGSEFGKGTEGMKDALQPKFTSFANKPIIIKDRYTVNGSDASQIGWVEVATEDGTTGYLWYLKAESETRLRYDDYLEMAMVEGELAASGSAAATAGFEGTEGMFAAIEERGNIYKGFAASSGLGDFDDILQNLDKQGAIEENMLFLNRPMNLNFDDMLARLNGGNAGAGSAYGLFDNDADMALNLGFSGFRRGSYDFYKTDWKYLNDPTTRGLMQEDIEGVLVPAGTSTVYDQMLGANIRRPFLHVRYRASETEDRRYKSWITGSVGGAYTSDVDAMEVHFLSERCLCVQAANNFLLFKK